MRRALLLLSTLTLVAACGDASRSVGPVMGNVPGFAISDGANTGGGPANGDFFFLPPMVPEPSGALTYDADAFDATLSPRIEICQLTTVEPRICAADPFRVFSGDQITVSTSDEQYQVNWHTDEDSEHLSVVDQLYRIQVLLPRHSHDGEARYQTIGFADVDPVSNGSELKQLRNMATGQVIGLVDGRTLPIKFRIERSPRCGDSDDCVEAIVSDDGGRVETESGYAIAEFSPGWLPTGFDQVVVAIRRVAIGSAAGQDASCHGTEHVQYEGCYDFETFPDVGTFAADVVVSTCIEPDAGALEPYLQLAASDEGQNFRPLPPRTVSIECEGFEGTGASDGPITFLDRVRERAFALGTRLGVALAPRELFAVDKGRGGAIDSFSHGGWFLPMSISRMAPQDETHVTSTGSAVPVSVIVRGAHDSDDDPTGLANMPVVFSIPDGGGSLSVSTAITNSAGVAETVWTVGAPGEYELTATVGDASLTFTAIVLEVIPITVVEIAPVSLDLSESATEQVTIVQRSATGAVITPTRPCTWNVNSARGTVAIDQNGVITVTRRTGELGDDGLVVVNCEGVSNGTTVTWTDNSFSALGVLFDEVDASPTASGPSPDATELSVEVQGRSLTIAITYDGVEADLSPFRTSVSFDTDENIETGHAGISARDPETDKGRDWEYIGLDYAVRVLGLTATVQRYDAQSDSFVEIREVPASLLVGEGSRTVSVTIDLADIGYDNGLLRFKGTTSRQLSETGFTGILDFISNEGTAAGQTQVPQ